MGQFTHYQQLTFTRSFFKRQAPWISSSGAAPHARIALCTPGDR
ncbi:hypothetical protein BH24CHL4_BH24CHL4_13940 [soil metagenome]